MPGGSHWIDDASAPRHSTQTKGGITDNGEESQGREEEGRQETVIADLSREKKGATVAPFSIADCQMLIAN